MSLYGESGNTERVSVLLQFWLNLFSPF